MTEQEPINEMAKVICNHLIKTANQDYLSCKSCSDDVHPCGFSQDIAEALYNAEYRKIKKGDIIIHKDQKECTDEEIKWLVEHNAEVRKRHEKFLEDSGNIILTKEDMQKYAKDCLIGEVAGLDILNGEIARGERKAEEARKETAIEILKDLKEILEKDDYDYYFEWKGIAKKYDVEVEE